MNPKSPILRFLAGALFIAGGGFLAFMTTIMGPSFWYFPCFCALVVVGLLWIWRPILAAPLSVGPLIAVAALFRYVPEMPAIWIAFLVSSFSLALLLVIIALSDTKAWRVPLAASLLFAGSAFATDRLFTNTVGIRAYQMQVALDGHAPWGEVGPEWHDGSPPVVVFRRMGDGYCYDAFHSSELRARLAPKAGGMVRVEYNTFSDFGREHSYNVRSVDGMILSNGQRAVKNIDSFGGQILGSRATQNSTDECH